MPKGGDLHHHYDGSIYTETFIDYAVKNDFWLNISTLVVQKEFSGNVQKDKSWRKISDLIQKNEFGVYKQKLLEKWSSKDFHASKGPSDDHFFSTFDGFSPAKDREIVSGLGELKNRALKENVSYIETMFLLFFKGKNGNEVDAFNTPLRVAQAKQSEEDLEKILDEMHAYFMKNGAENQAKIYNEGLAKIHNSNKIDDQNFTLRYQNAILRLKQPAEVFGDLLVCYLSDQGSQLINGVNIVGQEDRDVAMNDYWLHMQMYKYLNKKFPNTKNALHAGELSLGLVKPEDLSWHINEAISVANAKRVGHGIDMPFEKDAFSLLKKMKDEQIAVEINLTSNEFILNVKNDEHPISLYHQHGVPIVISTDDAGVLRTNLTEQYVLLAKRYPEFSYSEIKQLVFNSIRFSFIEEESLKTSILKKLENDFLEFEKIVFEK
ncbi:adenosine deaminase [Lacihabitans sp. CCS-44]|nr:adenosine deaminase [Lacihabitans sp. CCS-44]